MLAVDATSSLWRSVVHSRSNRSTKLRRHSAVPLASKLDLHVFRSQGTDRFSRSCSMVSNRMLILTVSLLLTVSSGATSAAVSS